MPFFWGHSITIPYFPQKRKRKTKIHGKRGLAVNFCFVNKTIYKLGFCGELGFQPRGGVGGFAPDTKNAKGGGVGGGNAL
jgi:hypothetical protein